jgi:hypothetical protein
MIDRSSLNPFLEQYSSQVEPAFAVVAINLINDRVWRWAKPPVLAPLPGRLSERTSLALGKTAHRSEV